MSRRAFLGLVADAVAWPFVVPPQGVTRLRQVGVLLARADQVIE
jgi:hypothetical protein